MRRFVAIVAVCSAAVWPACGRDRPPSATQAARRPRTAARAGTPPTADVYAHVGPRDIAPAVAGDLPRVYVPNSESNTVDVIDPRSLRIVDHFAVGTLPQHVTPAWDLRTLYVDNDEGNSLTPIDPRTGTRGAAIPVEDPYNLYFSPDGSKAIVVAERLHRLDVRDPHTWQLEKSIPIPFAGVDHADFTADGNDMVVTCEFSGWLVEVDLRTLSLTRSTHVGGQPIDVKLGPDGSVFYVANQRRNGVSVVDAATLEERSFTKTGKGTHGLYPSRDGRRLFATNRGDGTVSVLDFATGRVKDTWKVGGSPDMGGVTADGSQLWVSGRYDRSVYVVNTTTGRLIRRLRVGAGPHGLSVWPQPGRFSLGHTGVLR